MGFFDAIGDLFGGAPNNAGFQAGSAPIYTPVGSQQFAHAYGDSTDALAKQQQLLQALNAQNGIGNQSSVFGQLQGIANGQGPNPAQAMLDQATGANNSAQAALMAGQRGAGANVGLMARLAAQQGAANQQNAVGQGASMQAQQSLGALGQMGELANQQASNQIGGVGAYNQFAQNQQQQLLNAISAQNNALVGNQSSMNSANGAMAQVNAGNTAKALGGIASGGAGFMPTNTPAQTVNGQSLSGGLPGGSASGVSAGAGEGAGAMSAAALAAKGGVVSPGKVTPPRGQNPKLAEVPKKDRFAKDSHLHAVAEMYHGSMPMKSGGQVPGKALVSGDSPKNDIVDAKLSPGEVVIPRSVMESDDPAARAAKFVADLIKKGAKSPEGDFKEALKKAIAGRKAK